MVLFRQGRVKGRYKRSGKDGVGEVWRCGRGSVMHDVMTHRMSTLPPEVKVVDIRTDDFLVFVLPVLFSVDEGGGCKKEIEGGERRADDPFIYMFVCLYVYMYTHECHRW